MDVPLVDSLSSLLRCPKCKYLLSAPTTLRCGHTVCADHLGPPPRPTVCPVPDCQPLSASSPNIPAASSVAYHPAPSDPAVAQPVISYPSSPDISISKILFLVHRTQLECRRAPLPDSNPSSSFSSSLSLRSRSRSTSIDSTAPPRKRRRHRSPSHHSDHNHNDDDNDLLSRLRTQSALQRATRNDQPLIPPDSSSTPQNRDDILSRFEKSLLAELTCEVCLTIFYEPITTPCQHTFCSRCLHRSLDHSQTCPLCRQTLPGFLYFQDHPHNKLILSLILKAFPTSYQERGEAIDAEERDARLDTPIFICQLSFPGTPTLLHFFEPRYRLMLRRCLESPTPSFGMVMPPKPGGLEPHTEFGTMLQIRSVQMQPDGRSFVETWGTYRFRILERGTLDGYMVGRIERIDDYPDDITELRIEAPMSASSPSSSSSEPPSTAQPIPPPPADVAPGPNIFLASPHPSNSALMAQCRAFLDQLQQGTAPWIVQRLSTTYGSVPTDAASFSYWVASVLPIEDHEKAKLLPIQSPRLRLLLVVYWIEQLNNNWYTIFHFVRLVVLEWMWHLVKLVKLWNALRFWTSI